MPERERNILIYVSGHGLGHAVRMAEVVWALAHRPGGGRIHVRTQAPAALFAGIPRTVVSVPELPIDSGAVEISPLKIDPDSTLARAAALLSNTERAIQQELRFIREERIALIAADIPFLAGDIAAAAQRPCIAIGNFTWDYIFEPYLAERPEAGSVIDGIRRSYEKMALWLPARLNEPCRPMEQWSARRSWEAWPPGNKFTDVPLRYQR